MVNQITSVIFFVFSFHLFKQTRGKHNKLSKANLLLIVNTIYVGEEADSNCGVQSSEELHRTAPALLQVKLRWQEASLLRARPDACLVTLQLQ